MNSRTPMPHAGLNGAGTHSRPAPEPATAAPVDWPGLCAQALEQLRLRNPLVQSVTNTVVSNFTANALLALGASPAMVDIPGEAALFASIADGVLINLGTPTSEQREAALEAATGARESGTAWVLDPVAIGALPVRTALAGRLLAESPDIIRGNPSEIAALAGLGDGGRGVDATQDAESALPAATLLATRYGSVVAVSGATDIITDGTRTLRLSNGSPLLTQITGGGCALGSVLAAFAGSSRGAGADLFHATVAAVSVYNVAAEIAASTAAGPGSFAALFLDQLALVTPEQIAAKVRIR